MADNEQAEIENNLKILEAGIGVHKTAQLQLGDGVDQPARDVQQEQVARALSRLQKLATQRNPAQAQKVDWRAMLLRAQYKNPVGAPRDSFRESNADTKRPRDILNIAACDYKSPARLGIDTPRWFSSEDVL